MKRSKARKELTKDIFLIIVGILIATFLSRSGILDQILALIGNTALASFVAGIFFTSVFTIAPASVALVHIAEGGFVSEVALWGALGAMCGDLVLFFFIRDHFMEDVKNSLKPSMLKHFMTSFHLGFMKWLSPVVGALIIASPLPDELGVALLGLSKVRVVVLMPISFAMNVLGIYLIIWFTYLV